MLTQLRTPEGKRRRRRSEQPIHTARRRKRLWMIILISVLSLVLAGFYGFRYFQRLRLEGDTFRDGVNRRLSDALGCQVSLTRIRDGGEGTLSASEGRLENRDLELFENGAFSGLNAALTTASWVSDDWGITLLSITSGKIRLNPSRNLLAGNSMGWVPRTGGRERTSGGFRFGITAEPDKLSLDAIRFTGGLDLEWPVTGKETVEAIRGLQGSVKFPPTGGIEGAFLNGSLELQSLPRLKLGRLEWKLNGRKLDIVGGSIQLGGDARAELSGSANLATDGSIELKLGFRETPLALLLPSVWSDRVFGKMETSDASFQSTFGKGPERTYSGKFVIAGCVLKGMGFLNKLAYSLQRPDLTNVEFPSLTGAFKWSPSTGLELTELSADLEGTLRLSGSVTVGPAKVTGQLKASVTDTALRSRSRDIAHPFSPVSEGWASVDFTLSGTSAVLNDSIVIPGVPETSLRPSVSPSAVRESQSPPAAPEAPRTKDELEKQFNDLLPK